MTDAVAVRTSSGGTFCGLGKEQDDFEGRV